MSRFGKECTHSFISEPSAFHEIKITGGSAGRPARLIHGWGALRDRALPTILHLAPFRKHYSLTFAIPTFTVHSPTTRHSLHNSLPKNFDSS
jgi:hypothetical protein